MFGWKKRVIEHEGVVTFAGLPPRLENLSRQFADAGVKVAPLKGKGEFLWGAELTHPNWGKAGIVCPRHFEPIPRVMLQFDPRLDDADVQLAVSGKSGIAVSLQSAGGDVLRDRKQLLRFMRCLMDGDGLVAMDVTPKVWTREALDEELGHEADLDIESLFVTHLIHEPVPEGSDEEPKAYWAHTHGLAELGALDFDILRPSPLLVGAGYDTFRCISFLILEGKVGPSTDRHPVVLPNIECSFVSVEEFNRKAPADELALRDGTDDPTHNRDRLVLCDPRRRGLLGWLGFDKVRASRLLSSINDERMMCPFTPAATELMAERARQTFELLKKFSEEFREFEVQPLVKLGYVVDGGEGNDREHMWFEVNGFGREKVDATLLNEPFNIARMKAGDRTEHGLDVLTDWQIFTPIGSITPREMVAARRLRANREKFLELMAEAKKER